MKQIFKTIYVHLPFICFVGLLLLPALDRKLHLLPVYPETEKRDLAPRPNYAQLSPLPQTMHAFEMYWNDHFGGRSLLINLRARLWIQLFRDSPVSSVVIGKHGWLFYKSESRQDGPGLNDHQGLTPLTADELGDLVLSLNKVNHALRDQGITLIVLVAPNKNTIYPEEVPDNFPQLRPDTRLDQLIRVLPSDLLFVDVRAVLAEGKSVMPTYLTTDTHWNNYGAFLASQTLLRQLPAQYRIQPKTLADYKLKQEVVSGEGDLASMMAARGIFTDVFIGLEPKVPTKFVDYEYGFLDGAYSGHVWLQPKSRLPRLLFFGDSFRNSMAPFLAPHFSSSYVMGFTPHYRLNDDLIKVAKPNIIVWQVAERYLDRLKQ
jgi:alginate O-acetyltransferase complex protein AlgJ